MENRAELTARLKRYGAFLLAGGTGFLIYLALSNALHYLTGLAEGPAALLGTLLSVPPTYLMQRRFTFDSKVSNRAALPRYAALQACNALLIGSISALGAMMALPAYVAFVVAGVSGVLLSYWVQSRLIFKGR